MADKQIGNLPLAPQVLPTSLLAIEQNGKAMKMTGAQFAEFGKAAVTQHVESAKKYSEDAAKSATAAKDSEGAVSTSASEAADSAAAAADSQKKALASQTAAENAQKTIEQIHEHVEADAKQTHEDMLSAQLARQEAYDSELNAQLLAQQAEADRKIVQQGVTDAILARDRAETAADSAERNAQSASDSADTAQQYSGKPPKILHGTWWIWNATFQRYEDTGEAARGDVMFATFAIDITTGLLIMTTPDEYAGPQFYLRNGILEVSING